MSTDKEQKGTAAAKKTNAAAKKETAKTATPTDKEQTGSEIEVNPVTEKVNEEVKNTTDTKTETQVTEQAKEDPKPEEQKPPVQTIETPKISAEDQLDQSIKSYYEAIEVYFTETGELPVKDLKTNEIYDEAQKIKEQKQISEMQRLEILEANKPKTFAVTDGKSVINVTEKTFQYLGKEWKKSPTEPKEVQELKNSKND